jgi:hypothetical protein
MGVAIRELLPDSVVGELRGRSAIQAEIDSLMVLERRDEKGRLIAPPEREFLVEGPDGASFTAKALQFGRYTAHNWKVSLVDAR